MYKNTYIYILYIYIKCIFLIVWKKEKADFVGFIAEDSNRQVETTGLPARLGFYIQLQAILIHFRFEVYQQRCVKTVQPILHKYLQCIYNYINNAMRL